MYVHMTLEHACLGPKPNDPKATPTSAENANLRLEIQTTPF